MGCVFCKWSYCTCLVFPGVLSIVDAQPKNWEDGDDDDDDDGDDDYYCYYYYYNDEEDL